MAAFTVMIMSLLLALASFGFGLLPLLFTFSKAPLNHLSNLGSGLLLGAALGVIIPEGIETLAEASPATSFPTSKTAFALLAGFTFMLVAEHFLSGHSHPSSAPAAYTISLQHVPGDQTNEHDDIDAAIRDLENDSFLPASEENKRTLGDATGRSKVIPLTVGLIIHGLADGLALGATASSSTSEGSLSLSFVVFVALAIHKAPTAVAFTTSLLAMSVPLPQCRLLLAIFSASTPVGALLCFSLLDWLGVGVNNEWSGIALLVSGGTFLYVATVLAPGTHHHHHSEGGHTPSKEKSEIGLIVAGMFIPFIIGSLVGHDHEHVPASPNPT